MDASGIPVQFAVGVRNQIATIGIPNWKKTLNETEKTHAYSGTEGGGF